MNDIQDWLVTNEGFKERYQSLVITSVLSQFSAVEPYPAFQGLRPSWRYLLECASFLSTSVSGTCQDAALRIAQHCLASEDTPQLHKEAAGTILNQMANRPALKLASQKELLQSSFYHRLPVMSRLAWTRHGLENSIYLSGHSHISVNNFQKQFWNAVAANDWISVSAPTSAGKSYIIYRWIGDFLSKNHDAILIYLVPTRALIQQVESDLQSLLKTILKLDFSITTIPDKKYISEGIPNILVFTQERLHIFLSRLDEEPRIGAMVIDEAHKMGDNYRGILLQQVIERVIASNQTRRIIFASPLTSNPEILLSDAPKSLRTHPLHNDDVMVNQNVIWAKQVPRQTKVWELSFLIGDTPIPVGVIQLPYAPGTSSSKRLAILAYTIGISTGGNVVYVNRPSDAENVAELLYQLMGEEFNSKYQSELNALSDTVKSVIHKEYGLAKVVRRGIAYHYGNIPLLIRSEIERLFREGAINFLVCTSTLIEGVNMPCKNIFLRGPRKGARKVDIMKPADFWNLAGRAGRWGTEFQGNIFCIDPQREDLWHEGRAPRKREKYRIFRTTDSILKNADELIEFIEDGTPRNVAAKRPQLEYMTSYLMSALIREGSISNTPWANRISPETIDLLEQRLSTVRDNLSVSDDIVVRNPGISPIAMNSLYEYFCHRTHERREPIETLLPCLPASDEADKVYTGVFARINKTLGQKFGYTNKQTYFYALLVALWMRGYPLSRLISSRIKKAKESEHTINLPGIIRETMNDVEQIARFEAPKYLSCYTDILRQHLEEEGRTDLTKELLDLNIFLEFGVSQMTQVSLMSLGLSRTSTVMLTESIVADDWTAGEVLEWLRKKEWEEIDIPPLVKREVKDILELHSG